LQLNFTVGYTAYHISIFWIFIFWWY